MKILRYLLPATFSLLIATSPGSADLMEKATNKLSSFKDGKINALSNQVSENLSSFAQDHFENMKYLDFVSLFFVSEPKLTTYFTLPK